MGIDLDVRDDGHFKVLTDLAPYTIHAEGWRDGRRVFSASPYAATKHTPAAASQY